MDLSAFLANKAKQCNDPNFDGKSDWTADSVLAYYQERRINAVMVAGSASDPNVVAVPGNEAVTAPFGMTPWGVTTTPVDLDLTTGDDVLTITDVPVNFIRNRREHRGRHHFEPERPDHRRQPGQRAYRQHEQELGRL